MDGAELKSDHAQFSATWNKSSAGAPLENESETDLTFRSFMVCEGQPADKDPLVIAEKVLDFPEHEDIRNGGADIAWLFRVTEKLKHGRKVLGMCYSNPKVQGDLAPLFDDMLTRLLGRIPNFLICLDYEWWCEATPLQREILCHHELMHASQAKDLFGAPKFDRDGNPVWALRGHDLEEFNDVVRRYGVHSEDVETFLRAITDNMEGT